MDTLEIIKFKRLAGLRKARGGHLAPTIHRVEHMEEEQKFKVVGKEPSTYLMAPSRNYLSSCFLALMGCVFVSGCVSGCVFGVGASGLLNLAGQSPIH